MIYNEFSQGRAVCYGGQSTGGAHEFVCDGYQGEDYFHVNWGWGGVSDNYFKLSALDPDAQGIGGSSSTDGYHYGHDAVVGIQKAEETGTVMPLELNDNNISITNMSIDKSSASPGETVEVTMTIRNDGEKDYDGDLYIYDINGFGYLGGGVFCIPAGSSKEVKISFMPSDEAHEYEIRAVYHISTGESKWVPGLLSVSLSVTGSGSVVTNDVELTVTGFYIERRSEDQFYGSSLKGYFSVLNPMGDKTYSGNYEWGLFNAAGNKLLAYKSSAITILPNRTIMVPFEVNGLEFNTTYILADTYLKNSAWTSWVTRGSFTCKAAIIAYRYNEPGAVYYPTNTYSVPEQATSVDLTGCGVTTVTPNSKPNTLYILGSSDVVPAGLESANVIKGDGSGNYTAAKITLADGQNFYSPVDFTATNIEFTYANDKQADGTGGWNTIMLPYDVAKVTADDTEIQWFTSSSDSGKDFWVKEFASDEVGVVNFAYAAKMKANTPYIIALPGDHWGSEYDLSGKTIKFIGENAVVSKTNITETVTGGNYRFMGNTIAVPMPNIYSLNDEGNSFVLKASGSSPAFRAYFKPGIFDRTVQMLRIGTESDGGTTAIRPVDNSQFTTQHTAVYDLQGRKVNAKPSKGIYIVNGKKVVVK